MDKEKILNDLKVALNTGVISKDEVSSLVGVSRMESVNTGDSVIRRFGVSEILYFIGGLIVLIGLVILIAQNWMDMSYGARVFSTFGAGVAFFIGAVSLSKTKVLGRLDNIFYILSAILIAGGYFVIFQKYMNASNMNIFLMLVPFLLLLQFGITQLLTKKDVFTLFNAVFGTWLFFSVTNTLISNSYNRFGGNFDIYRAMIVGVSYLLFGYYLQMKQRLFHSFFDIIGVLIVLGTSFTLNISAGATFYGGTPQTSSAWSILFPLILIAILFASIYFKKSSYLFIGTLFLVAYLVKITAQYFSDVTGWPIALIFLGIIIIGLGYLAIYINKKYIKSAVI